MTLLMTFPAAPPKVVEGVKYISSHKTIQLIRGENSSLLVVASGRGSSHLLKISGEATGPVGLVLTGALFEVIM